MLRRLALRRIDAAEADLGVSLDYLRHIARASLGALFAFSKFLRFASYRRALPLDASHVARLVATRAEDCGTCVQIVVNQATKDGLPPEVLRAVLDRRPDELPEDLADVYRFAEAVATITGEEGPLRERLRQRYGEAGLVELSFAIASARVFPTVKRGLGYATSCSVVDGRQVGSRQVGSRQ